MPAVIVCNTLGQVDVTVGDAGAPPELLWKKHLALLVYLARTPRRGRAREHLIGLLWPDKPESAARQSLNEALRILRRAAGRAGVITSGDQVRLAPDVVELDTDRFEALLTAGRTREAADLVRGEFLEGFGVPGASGFEDWLTAERMLWRERGVAALAQGVEELLSAGEADPAVEVAQRAMALNPTAETAIRGLMRALALAGDRVGALAAYEEFVERARAAAGVEPGAETRALAERLRRERAPAPPPVTPPPPRRRAPLVGRAAELGQLVAAWDGCRRGSRATILLVEGDSGTGKTRLAEELGARARLDGATVVVARAVEADLADSGSGLLGLARGGLLLAPGLAGASTAALAAFATRLPEWMDRFPEPGRTAPQARLEHAFLDVVRAVVAEAPLLVLLDDAQWADRDSLLVLDAALRDLARQPLCVAGTLSAAPPRLEVEELRARIGRELDGTAVRLGPLSHEDLRALARWALPHYSETQLDRVVRRVSTDSAGLPLLAVELLVAVGEGLDLGAGAGWPEPLKTLDQSLPGDLPEAVVGAIRVGFRRVSEAAREVLRAASVLGDRVPPDRLVRATGLDAATVTAALDELEWQRWLTFEGRGYSFRARIVRDVVARDQLTEGQRRRLQDRATA